MVTLWVCNIPIETEITVDEEVSQVHRIDEELLVQPQKGDNINMIWKRGDDQPDEALEHALDLHYTGAEKDGDIAQRSVRYRGRGNVITFEF
mgnify:CR=1 FL=1